MDEIFNGAGERSEGRRAFLSRMVAVAGVVAVPAVVSFGLQGRASASPASVGGASNTGGGSNTSVADCRRAQATYNRMSAAVTSADAQIAAVQTAITTRTNAGLSVTNHNARLVSLQARRAAAVVKRDEAQAVLATCGGGSPSTTIPS